jgi:TolA-binding protein
MNIFLRTACPAIFLILPALFPLRLGCVEPPAEDSVYHQALQLFNQKKWDDAQNAFLQFQTQYPNSRWKHMVKLRLADLESDPDRAQTLYAEVVKAIGPGEEGREARWGLAGSLLVLGRYAAAAMHFLEMSQSDNPYRVQALYSAGLCQFSLSQFDEAKKNFSKVVAQFHDSPWAELALAGWGETELASKNTTTALTLFDRYLAEYPNGRLTDEILMQKSSALDTQGKGAKARQILHQLVAQNTGGFETEKAGRRLNLVHETYTLQVGAFSKYEYAEKLLKKLKAKGYAPGIVEAASGNDVFKQVRLGKYPTREDAEKAGKKLENKEKLPYLVISCERP